MFVVELVVESKETRDKWFAEWGATGKADAFWKKWNTLAERMVAEERWNMTELEEYHPVRCDLSRAPGKRCAVHGRP